MKNQFSNFKHFLPKVEFLKYTLNETIFGVGEKFQLRVIDTSFSFVDTKHLQQILSESAQQFDEGLLGFDENHRLIVYGKNCIYPVVGLWTKGIDIGNVFLKNQINEQIKKTLINLFNKYAMSTSFSKVSFSTENIRFLYVPFISKGVTPPVLLVDLGPRKVKENSHHVIEESFPIDEPMKAVKPQMNQKRQNNFKLWENFLNKTSLQEEEIKISAKDSDMILDKIEERIQTLNKDFDDILNKLKNENIQPKLLAKAYASHKSNCEPKNEQNESLEEECLKTESDVQSSNYPQQFQKLLRQSSRQLFTGRSGRSLHSNQKTNCRQVFNTQQSSNEKFILSRKDTQTKISPLKKLQSSIYDQLNQTNQFQSSEGKRLSIGQLHDVNSFFADAPAIRCSQRNH